MDTALGSLQETTASHCGFPSRFEIWSRVLASHARWSDKLIVIVRSVTLLVIRGIAAFVIITIMIPPVLLPLLMPLGWLLLEIL